MSSSASGDRRRYFRLRYPEAERPRIHFDNLEFRVTELSETGVRIALCHFQISEGKTIIGSIYFRDDEAIPIEGFALRTEGDEAILKLYHGVSFKKMLAEQRRMIHDYPMLFERSEAIPRGE